MHLNIKDIKKGDRFWERNRQYQAIEDARKKEIVIAENSILQYYVWGYLVDNGYLDTKSQVEFLETDGLEHYGPRLNTKNLYQSYGTNPII
jgi:hypothetical protein